MKSGIDLIYEERESQLKDKNFSIENDSKYRNNELICAAVAYALPENSNPLSIVQSVQVGLFITIKRFVFWPWSEKWWKPTPENRIKELAKAGALIAAEIDRLQYVKPHKNA